MYMQYSQFILALYRQAQVAELASLKSWALEQLRVMIPFDSALWLEGGHHGQDLEVDTIHLHGQPEAMIVAYAERCQHDRILSALSENPGCAITLNDLWTREEYEASHFYRQFAREFGIEQILSAEALNSQTCKSNIISLYREGRSVPFMEDESQHLQFIIYHLAEACDVSRTCSMSAFMKRPADSEEHEDTPLPSRFQHSKAH